MKRDTSIVLISSNSTSREQSEVKRVDNLNNDEKSRNYTAKFALPLIEEEDNTIMSRQNNK